MRLTRHAGSDMLLCVSSEFNSDDPIQYTHTITRHDVDIQITNQQNTPTEDPSAAAASNDANQVRTRRSPARSRHVLRFEGLLATYH